MCTPVVASLLALYYCTAVYSVRLNFLSVDEMRNSLGTTDVTQEARIPKLLRMLQFRWMGFGLEHSQFVYGPLL